MATPLVTLARAAFADALVPLDAGRAVERAVRVDGGAIVVGDRVVPIAERRDVRVAAFGKAADAMIGAMARRLGEAGLGDGCARGLVVAHVDGVSRVRWAERVVGGHPVPNAASLAAGARLLGLFDGCTRETLAVFLVSGGGSALVEAPVDQSLTADDFAAINRSMLACALSIREINAIRKRLSAVKGGRLARHASPAEQVTLIVSDVVPGEDATVASGSTVPDDTTAEEVRSAVAKLQRGAELPERVARVLAAVGDTDAALNEHIYKGYAATVLDCRDAARAVANAVAAGVVENLDVQDGELAEVVDAHLVEAERLASANPGRTVAVVSSGEVELSVEGPGRGGRNQHSVLYALGRIAALCPSVREIAVLSAGTDGRDGGTDAAGAVGDLGTIARAAAEGASITDFLARFDSNGFFDRCGGLIVTGPTGTNVRDVRIVLARS